MPRIVPQFTRSTVETATLDLPFPPSANALWRSAKGRVFKSLRYRTWWQAAGTMLNAQRPGCVRGNFTIQIVLGRPDRRHRDSDNYAKAILDLLQAYGVIENDSKQMDTRITWSDAKSGAHVVVSKWREAVRAAA
jgi:crossover junction endodeoxyribonuclease RusA